MLSRAGIFGSAQTLNMIEVVCTLLGRDYFHFFLRIICMVLYIAAISIGTVLMKRSAASARRYAIAVDAAQLDRAKFFANSILWYHVGVVASFFACKAFAIRASLCAFPPVCLAMALTFFPEKENVVLHDVIKDIT